MDLFIEQQVQQLKIMMVFIAKCVGTKLNEYI